MKNKKTIKIKVSYDPETTLVKGYYPDFINYSNVPKPFIEIIESQQNTSKTMCVIEGIYQEYIENYNIKLEKIKIDKINQIKTRAKILIEEVYPSHKQLNYLADVAFIQNKQITNQEVNQDELNLLEEAKEARLFIKSIRDQSNDSEVLINNCVTLEEINNIVI